jgi:hypothetical protein
MPLTACTVIALAALVPAEPPKDQPQRAKWEYKEVQIDQARYDPLGKKDRDKTIEEMNKLGDERWECVQFLVGESGAGFMGRPSRILYKRRVDSAAQAIWEYSVVDPASQTLQSVTKQLSKVGENGWELASIVLRPFSRSNGPGGAPDTVYLLKRPK